MSRLSITGLNRFAVVTIVILVSAILLIRSRQEARQTAALSRLSLVSSLRAGGVLAELGSARSDAVLWSGFGNVKQRLMDLEEAWEDMGPEATTLLREAFIEGNPYPEGERHLLADPGGGSIYSRVHADFHPRIGEFLTVHDYYDLLVVNPSARVVYSFHKEDDFASDMASGPWRDTQAARVTREALTLEPGQTALSDFEPYEPSQGEWAMFIAGPIALEDGPTDKGALMFQLSPRRLGGHLTRSAQQATSVRTVLLGRGYKIVGREPWIEPVEGEGNELEAEVRGRAGEEGEGFAILEDETGRRVLAAWTGISFEGLDWVVLSVMDATDTRVDGTSERQAIGLIALLIWFAGAVLTLGRRREHPLGQHRI